ncbi:2Fe-2S iron-sulfur cluster-binding protein [Celeribacter baekdonensis]|uniref:2-polyprenylphenol hydroxylase/CDP-6-deoxy-delta-3,4-glucoseen reductase-like protein n=1 Tax=Celeribacter baekdonensis B30 TaxID=1208323 RepID=K2ICA4_9RHOB|nr:2Fe-2S iron-sulfur cluster-binding protein [Celeribacter baekdonensis]EKE67551.1 2-polyprenylphenol hydroxylase/CDP-6-deoxy-delta-3,4-glucoseen reductase-like protein [Celeribacter baekdonensis B30]
MTHKISVFGEDISFECGESETVLDAAERAGFSIPYSCRKGVCSSCEGVITSGEAVVRGQGVCVGPASGVLLCQARPRTNLEIVPRNIKKTDPVSRKIFEAKVRKIEQPTPDVSVINLRFPIGNRSVFQAGQYLSVLMPDGDSRNYSMANPPHQNDGAELHIRHVSGGKFSQTVLANLEKGSILSVELPFGNFTLNENTEVPAILIATGTGFAPIKSIVEHQIREGGSRPLHLYWGANTEADIYLRSLPEMWAAKHDWFTFTPVLSEPPSAWKGRTGFVHKAVQSDFPDMSDLEVYACGAPMMIDAASKDFCAESKLDRAAFYSDAFVPSGEPADDLPA